MARASLQIAAAHVLRDVIDQGRSLDQTLQAQERQVLPDQVGALREIGFGGCRHYCHLDGIISSLLSKPIRRKDRMIHFLLVAGLYQIIHMRVPDHAAVNQSVAALSASRQAWARGLVNGVLRGYLRIRDDGRLTELEEELTPAQRMSLPTHLHQWIQQAWPDHAGAIFRAFNERPPMTLRINPLKTTREDYRMLLDDRGIGAEITRDSPVGMNLASPSGVGAIPMFEEGWVSVQDESAQLCVAAMGLRPGLRVLDACAAPGGKTCAFLESEPGIRLTAVDLPERADGIRQNLRRIGLEAEIRTGGLEELADWREWDPWDCILLDVPCSGTGVIRRHPDIRHRRQPGDLERFATQQRHLLETAWELLVPGGTLLYVTCSIMPRENDGVIDGFLRRHTSARVNPLAGIPGLATRHGIQRLPGVHDGDGFYYCRLGKL